MGRFKEYESFDGLGLAELVKKGEVTPLELVDEAIERVERHNPRLHAVAERMDRLARAAARQAPGDGPFAGVPFVLKDLLASYAGVPLRSGSKRFAAYTPDHDSEMVARQKRAGLIAVAKSTTPEFGILPVTETLTHPPTETPWGRGRTSGGSSGGSGSCVGARIVPIGHGGDGGGSIRIPASCCGVFGLKPTRGRNPHGPDASEGWFGLATEHAITRSVRDSAALLDATSGPEPGAVLFAPPPERPFLDETRREPGPLRIAFTSRPFLPGKAHPDCVAAVEDAARLCASLGHHVEEARPDIDEAQFGADMVTFVSVATALTIQRSEDQLRTPARRHEFATPTWVLAMLGRTRSALDLALARDRMHALTRQTAPFFQRFDILLCPTLALPPLRVGELDPSLPERIAQEIIARGNLGAILKLPGLIDSMARQVFRFAPFTALANATGQPSMSVPLFWNHQNLPIGTTFTARFGDDATLFRLAAQLEQARPWASRKPDLG